MTLFAELGDRWKLRHASVGIICVLLVLFAVNAKVAAYNPHQAALAATKIDVKGTLSPVGHMVIRQAVLPPVAVVVAALLLFGPVLTPIGRVGRDTPRPFRAALLVPLAVRPPPAR